MMVKFYYKTRSTALDMILSCHVNVVENARLNNDNNNNNNNLVGKQADS